MTLKTFELTVLDCLKGVNAAVNKLNFYNFRNFEVDTYENDYSLIEGCDLNWVIPRKICALSSPNSIEATNHALKVFKKGGVKHLIRLNDDAHYD